MTMIRGSTALVTGASKGLGVALAKALAQGGANLILAARSRDRLAQVASELTALGVEVRTVPCDLSTTQGVEQLVRDLEPLGAIDILVNNAGMAAMLPYHRTPQEEIIRELQVNLVSPLVLTRLLLPGMLARGRGHVVNIASVGGEVPLPYEAIYCATKGALTVSTKALRLEYLGTGVGLSVILPGVVRDTGMAESFAQHTGINFPWYWGGCSGDQVGRAVVRAIEKNRAETIVNWPPMRGTLSLFRLLPVLWEVMVVRTSMLSMAKRAAGLNLEAGGRFTQVSTSPADLPKAQ